MRRSLKVLAIVSAATAIVGATAVSALADRPMAAGHITGAKLASGWYSSQYKSVAVQLEGNGPKCGVQAVFDRKEDGARFHVMFGAQTLPGGGGGSFPGPLGIAPGTYAVNVTGAPEPQVGACTGTVSAGTVVVDEAVLGRNFPRITGAKWEGATRNGGAIGMYSASSKADKFLEVNLVNYLDGGHFTPTTPTMVNPVCAVTVMVHYGVIDKNGVHHDMNVTWKDPYPLVLAATPGHTPVYRGQIVTPGPGGGTYRANITEIIRQYQGMSKDDLFWIVVASDPMQNGQGEAPCIGRATAALQVE